MTTLGETNTPPPAGGHDTEPPVRASDVDRLATVRVLQDAVARGLLTPDEGSERMAAAFAAVRLAELGPLIGDLPSARRAVSTAPGWRPLAGMAVAQVRSSMRPPAPRAGRRRGARRGPPAGAARVARRRAARRRRIRPWRVRSRRVRPRLSPVDRAHAVVIPAAVITADGGVAVYARLSTGLFVPWFTDYVGLTGAAEPVFVTVVPALVLRFAALTAALPLPAARPGSPGCGSSRRWRPTRLTGITP